MTITELCNRKTLELKLNARGELNSRGPRRWWQFGKEKAQLKTVGLFIYGGAGVN